MTKTKTAQVSLYSVFADHAARLTAKGATQGDIARLVFFANERACADVEGAIDVNIIKSMTNQKAIMRAAQAVNFISSGDGRAFDRSTALIVSACALSSQSTIDYQSMRFAMGGTGNNDTAHIKGVSRAKLAKFLGTIPNEGTRVSQCSRTVGKNGFLTALGIVQGEGKHAFSIKNRAHAFLVAYAARLQSMTDGQFALLTEAK